MVGPGGSPEDKGSRPDEDLLVIRVPISVWAIHVMGSERGVLTAWGGLAGNEVRRFPAQAGGPREGSGPIKAPDSGDDVEFGMGPSPPSFGPIKDGEVPPSRVCVFTRCVPVPASCF